MSIILGIDPGSRVTGYGVIATDSKAIQPRYIASGCIRLDGKDIAPRLQVIFESLQQLIKQYQPDEFAIEQVFVGKNASSALKLGHARGVAILAATMQNLPVAEYAARSIKQAVTGTGAADKEQVQSMVTRLLALNAVPQADAADALAVALCHCYNTRYLSKVASAENRLESQTARPAKVKS